MNTGRCKMHPVHLLMPVIVIALCAGARTEAVSAGAYPVLDGAVCTVNANAPNGRMRVVPSADVPPGANVASSFAAEDNWAAALKKKTDIPERKFGMLVVDELTQRTCVAGHPRSKGQRDVDGGGLMPAVEGLIPTTISPKRALSCPLIPDKLSGILNLEKNYTVYIFHMKK